MSVSIGMKYYFASFTSSTARPLYAPHLGQARWGSFFSWQLGHSESPDAVRKSWARRMAVRRVEWRLFGFGMMQFLSILAARPACALSASIPRRDYDRRRRGTRLRADFSGLDPAAQPGQRLPARIAWTLVAGAGLSVAIGSAARAKSLAVGLAQRPDRQGQKHLLAQHIFKQQTVLLIITDFGLRRRNGALGGPGIGADGPKDEVEFGGERNFDRLDAAGAGNLEICPRSGP